MSLYINSNGKPQNLPSHLKKLLDDYRFGLQQIANQVTMIKATGEALDRLAQTWGIERHDGQVPQIPED